MSNQMALAICLVAVAWAVPLLLLFRGMLRSRGQQRADSPAWDWRLMIVSTLLCVIAFNLVFLMQEFFLVLPKALVPGLKPTLYHNDHSWTGTAPIAELFEGTGALAILIAGVAFKILVDRSSGASWLGLFAMWLAFEGVFQALPQFVLGAIVPMNDVGRAYAYLHMGSGARTAIALLALAAIPCAGIWIGRSALLFTPEAGALWSWRSRTRILAQLVSVPALAAVPLIIPFRIPREPIEVVLLPLLVQLMGGAWVAASALVKTRQSAKAMPTSRPILMAAAIAVALLLFFQFALRPGIHFY